MGLRGSRVWLITPGEALAPYVHAIALRRPDPAAPPPPQEQGFPAHLFGALTIVSAGSLMDAESGQALAPLEFSGPRLRPVRRSYGGEPAVSTMLFKPGVLPWALNEPAVRWVDHREALVGQFPMIDGQALLRGLQEPVSLARQVWHLENWVQGWLQGVASRRPWSAPVLPTDPLPTDVDTWARQQGVSARQLQRLIQRHLGAPPKRVLRLLRLHQGLKALERQPRMRRAADLDDLALRLGYCDASHMRREFQSLAGLKTQALLPALHNSPLPWIYQPGDLGSH